MKLDGLITGEDLNEFEAFDLYDFKYSNNAKNYAVSGQLHEYKYWYELTHPGHRIRNMYFLIVPKPKIRQKSTETLSQFRDRLQAALKDAEPTLMPVQYNPMKIVDFLTDVKHMVEATDFPKNPNHFCGWCEYEEYCQKGWDYMLLPKNERRDLNATKKKVVWLYGAPFSGKTFFANQFPDPLMLNTDGNIKFVDAPYIAIRDTVTVEGRITKRKLAYEVFMDAVAELEKKKTEMLGTVYRMLVLTLGEPVSTFTWSLKGGEAKEYTPVSFYKEFLGNDLTNNYVMLMNDPSREFYKCYEIDFDRHRYDGKNWTYVNLPIEDIKEIAIASIKDSTMMYFSCDVGKFLDSKRGLLDPDNYDYESLMGTTFGMDKKQRIQTFSSGSSHAMTLMAVDLDKAGKPKKWMVENSWGSASGYRGHLIMTDKWFDEYMFRVVAEKKYVPAKVLDILKQKPIRLPAWDPMFADEE